MSCQANQACAALNNLDAYCFFVSWRLAAALTWHLSSRYCFLQGLESCVFGLMLLSLRLMFSVFITQRRKSGKVPAAEDHPQRQPRLVRHAFALLHNGTCAVPRVD